MITGNKLLFATFLLILTFFSVSDNYLYAQESQAVDKLVKVSIASEYSHVPKEGEFWLGVFFEIEDDWHLYWRNPGDSGLPPYIDWELPSGLRVEEPLWPAPERIQVAHLTNYGYEKELLLPVRAEYEGPTGVSSITVAANIDFLVCKEDCLPGEARVEIVLPVAAVDSSPLPSALSLRIHQALNNLPIPSEGLNPAASIKEGEIMLQFDAPGDVLEAALFFPAEPIILNSAPQRLEYLFKGRYGITLTRNNKVDPQNLSGVLQLLNETQASPSYFLIDVPLEARQGITELDMPLAEGGFLLAILLAFLGGLILNVMPCVFPIISIKVLSFLNYSRKNAGEVKVHGLLFSSGILVSFWVLAVIILAIRTGGQQLGWGFQLQSPYFISLMVFFFTFLALNLMGVFEIGVRLQATAGALSMGKKGSYAASFGNGMLATLIASPCTAPFMGTALGVSLSLSSAKSFAIFSGLGIGMASPYLILSIWPSLLKALPRPGVWMEIFKQLMAFPLLATVVWLLWVLSRQLGEGAVLSHLVVLLVFSLGLFFFGKGQAAGLAQRIGTGAVAICLVVSSVLFSYREINFYQLRERPVASSAETYIDQYGLEWRSFTADTFDEIVGSAQPVFVDFTAAWCVTCIVNKEVVFSSEEVRAQIDAANVILIRGDWTNGDPIITSALAKFGRTGVPLNLFYGRDKSRAPVILPALVTPSVFLSILNDLG
jgi:thiol:disulfide interchange protein DsbD